MPATSTSVRNLSVLLFALVACDNSDWVPPMELLHTVGIEDALHAPRLATPFLCGDESGEESDGFTCTPDRGMDSTLWSCDAAGCHGVYDFESDGFGATRTLRGGEGPSCFTCHSMNWDERKEGEP